MTSCEIKPYIQSLTSDVEEQKRLNNIHNEIFDRLHESKLFRTFKGKLYEANSKELLNKGRQLIGEINKEYGTHVSMASNTIHVNVRNLLNEKQHVETQKLTEKELGAQQKIEDEAALGITPEGDSDTNLLQTTNTEISKASPETISKVREWMRRAGIDEKQLDTNKFKGVNGVADALNGVISIAEGKESTALTEEAMHIAVAIIQQTNSSLYKEMLNKISSYRAYIPILNEYSKIYLTKDGKPDILKIKQEAIGKVLASTVINKNEGSLEKPSDIAQNESWWGKIINFFKSLISKAGFSPFEETASKILSNTLEGSVNSLKNNSSYSQLNYNPEAINATLKLVKAFESPKILNIFNRFYNSPNRDKFYQELLQYAPSQQVEMLKQWIDKNHPQIYADVIIGVRAELSYTTEINTAKHKYAYDATDPDYDTQGNIIRYTDNAQHYANLTVPGGTNYTENEISTPDITPSIKGHAAFSTDNGIGWFRSDDKALGGETKDIEGALQDVDFDDEGRPVGSFAKAQKTFGGEATKTRRILEVQSDLFQKGRDNKKLVGEKGQLDETYDEAIQALKEAVKRGDWTQEEADKEIKRLDREKDSKENQFLQLLNKDNNWVTFFVKSIIQDSAKKGYENVLFPTGDTAAKVEGHETLSSYIAFREKKLRELEPKLKDSEKESEYWTLVPSDRSGSAGRYSTKQEAQNSLNNSDNSYIRNNKDKFTIEKKIDKAPNYQRQYDQFSKELKEAKEGTVKLGAIHSFYETTIANILKKNGYNPELITDEYGNTWNKIATNENQLGEFYFQITNNSQQTSYDKLKSSDAKIIKIDGGNGQSHYEIDGKIVKNRVTDLAKKYDERIFGKKLDKEEYEKLADEVKREKGTAGHADLENIFHNSIDENGLLRDFPLEDDSYISQINPNDRDMYELLKANLQERLTTFPKGTKFLSEIKIYDAKKDEAGTIDFLAIEPSGKTNILDWKFVGLNTDKYQDIPSTKTKAYQIQIGEYKRILRDVYGIKEFGQTRAIPILAKYKYFPIKENKPPALESIKIGDVNVKNTTEDYLLPVALPEESTGKKEIDKLLTKLNALQKNIEKAPVVEGRKDQKAELINGLYTAIRQLQIKENFNPLLNHVEDMLSIAKKTIERVNSLPDQLENNDISDISNKLLETKESLDIYKELDTAFKNYKTGDYEKIRETASEARTVIDDLQDVYKEFANKYISEARGVKGLLNPEKSVTGVRRYFRKLSKSYTSAMQTLFSMTSEAENKTENSLRGIVNDLQNIKKGIDEWSKGKKALDYLKLLRKPDSNVLIDQYSKDFYKTLKNKIDEKDIKWIKENINLEEFKKWADEYRTSKIKQIEETTFRGNEAEKEKRKQEEIVKIDNLTNYKADFAFLQYNNIKNFPINSYYSKEYQELSKPENSPILDFYNYISNYNKRAAEYGYLSARQKRNFLPFIKKSLLEKIALGGNVHLFSDFVNSLTINDSEEGMGNYNKLTGQLEDSIPKYFTSDTGEGKTDEKGNKYIDYSTTSDDLIKNMGIFAARVEDYISKSEIEAQTKLLLFTEKNKESLATNYYGKILPGDPIPNNEKNASLLENFIKNTIYGQAYTNTNQVDAVGGKIGEAYNNFAAKFNKIVNILPVVPDEIAGKKLSLTKTIAKANKFYEMKVLGVNLGTSIYRYLGTNFQGLINSGRYYTAKEFFAAEWKHAGHQFIKDNDLLHISALKEFLPVEDQLQQEIERLSASKLSQHSVSELLMDMMRRAHNIVQYTNFEAMLRNAILVDGEIYNAREYYRNSSEFSSRYTDKSQEERKSLEKSFDSKVEELKKQHSLIDKLSLKDGRLNIEGLKMTDQTVAKFKNVMREVGRVATGNISRNNESLIRMNVLTRSMMMFKNWIPGLAEIRFSELSYNKGIDSYEWGRMRMASKVISKGLLNSISNMSSIIKGTDKGVQILHEIYEEKKQSYEINNRKEFTMTPSEFNDMMREGIRVQAKETAILLSLFGVLLAAKAWTHGHKDEKDTIGFYNFSLRILERAKDEVALYYNPLSMEAIVNGSIFPSLAVLTDIEKLTTNFMEEGMGLAFHNGEWVKSAHPAKYLFKTFPVSKELLNYIVIFFPELAKEMNITINPNPQTH